MLEIGEKLKMIVRGSQVLRRMLPLVVGCWLSGTSIKLSRNTQDITDGSVFNEIPSVL